MKYSATQLVIEQCLAKFEARSHTRDFDDIRQFPPKGKREQNKTLAFHDEHHALRGVTTRLLGLRPSVADSTTSCWPWKTG